MLKRMSLTVFMVMMISALLALKCGQSVAPETGDIEIELSVTFADSDAKNSGAEDKARAAGKQGKTAALQKADAVKVMVFDHNPQTLPGHEEPVQAEGHVDEIEERGVYKWSVWKEDLEENLPLVSETELNVNFNTGAVSGTVQGIEGYNLIVIAALESDDMVYMGYQKVNCVYGEKNSADIRMDYTGSRAPVSGEIRILTLTSTTINGSTLSGAAPQFTVGAGEGISGTATLHYEHNQADSHVIPLAATPNWGDRTRDYWEVDGDIENNSRTTASIELTAPTSPGVYYLIFAAQSEYTAAQVMSATSWHASEVVWNDGNDLFDLSQTQLEEARENGTLTLQKYDGDNFNNAVYGVTAIRLQVTAGGGTQNYLSVSPGSVTLDEDQGSTETFTITSNIAWSVSANETWLSVSPVSGSNNGTITVTANSGNTETTDREATVTVSGTGVSDAEVTVIQTGTEAGPAAPNLSQPANGSRITAQTVDFSWSSVSGAYYYNIQVSSSNAFASLLVDEESSITSYSTGQLDVGTWYWRVRTQGSGGVWGDWSAVWSVTLEAGGGGIVYGSMTGNDGKTYQTVQIGTQVWMAENLRETEYRNGESIPVEIDNTAWAGLDSGARCSYENEEGNAETYGYLYNWYAVNDSRNIAPSGWHVPTDEEWKTLEKYLGMSQADADETGWRGTDEGGKLKETGTSHWQSPNEGATDEYGFSALPGGFRDLDGFYSIGNYAFFWSATELNSDNAWGRYLRYTLTVVGRPNTDKGNGFSIRLLRD